MAETATRPDVRRNGAGGRPFKAHNEMTEFIDANRRFWASYPESGKDAVLLVETSDNVLINHSNAVAAKIVARAKHYRIGWLKEDFTDEALMRSYSRNSLFIRRERPSLWLVFGFLSRALYFYLAYAVFSDRILSFRYKGIVYGDCVYDGYLARYCYATLHRFDPRLVVVFYSLLFRDFQARRLLKTENIKAILTAHYVGVNKGALVRVALQNNIPAYWKGGGHGIICLSLFKGLPDVYKYPLKPSFEEMEHAVNNFSRTIEEEFRDMICQANNPFLGAFPVEEDNEIPEQQNREEFFKKMGMEHRPIVFVMLHCFNDFPHSHFEWMIFRDYYDWFRQTLEFAVKDTSKNWIFKEHPANVYYPAHDIDMNQIMSTAPGHVRYAPCDSDITPLTVLNVADMIVTCLGSPGVEMPALRGIPALLAGEASFSGLGFNIEPRTKEEYFSVLKGFIPRRLSTEQRLRAKFCYLYMLKYTTVPFAAGPALTFAESRDNEQLKAVYPGRILAAYHQQKTLIQNQFLQYVEDVGKNNFSRLTCLPGRRNSMAYGHSRGDSKWRG